MHWIIQENIIKNQDPYIKALQELGVPFTLVKIDEKGKIVSSFPKEEKIWAFGSAALVRSVREDTSVSPGVIFNPETFSFSSLLSNYGNKCLNADAKIAAIKDIQIDDARTYFIRPNAGRKLFAGTVVSQYTLNDFKKRVRKKEFSFDDTELVVISKKRLIDEEYRLFVVDGNVVTGCQYMFRGNINLVPGLPNDILEFAQDVIQKWMPEKSFVLDIARTPLGIKIIETNCINSSGPYVADMKEVVLALEKTYSF